MANLGESQGVDVALVSDADATGSAPIVAPAEDATQETTEQTDDDTPQETGEEGEKKFDPDDIELTEEDIEDEGKAEVEAIEPPEFWKEKGKEVWDKIPKEAQEEIIRQDAIKSDFVNRKRVEAEHAREDAYRQASNAFVEQMETNAWALERLFPAPQVNQPDPNLLYGTAEQQAFYHQQKAQSDAILANHSQMESKIAEMRAAAKAVSEAEQRQEQQAESAALIAAFPVLADIQSEGAAALLNRLESAAIKAGYDREILRDAGAADFKAFSFVADLIEENAKLKGIEAKWAKKQNEAKMKFARSFKKTPGAVPGQSTQTAEGSGNPDLERQKALYPTMFK